MSIRCDPERDSPRYVALRAPNTSTTTFAKHQNKQRRREDREREKGKELKVPDFNCLRARNTGNSCKTYRGHNVDNRESAITARQLSARCLKSSSALKLLSRAHERGTTVMPSN